MNVDVLLVCVLWYRTRYTHSLAYSLVLIGLNHSMMLVFYSLLCRCARYTTIYCCCITCSSTDSYS